MIDYPRSCDLMIIIPSSLCQRRRRIMGQSLPLHGTEHAQAFVTIIVLTRACQRWWRSLFLVGYGFLIFRVCCRFWLILFVCLFFSLFLRQFVFNRNVEPEQSISCSSFVIHYYLSKGTFLYFILDNMVYLGFTSSSLASFIHRERENKWLFILIHCLDLFPFD